MKRALSSIVIFSSLLFIACGGDSATTGSNSIEGDAKPAFDPAAARKTIDSLNSLFSGFIARVDTVGLANLYSTDATLMAPNMTTASGRSAIQSAFSGMLAMMGPVNINLTTTDLWGYNVLLTEVGTYTITTKGGKEIDKGKYIDIWKNEDGNWKLHRDIFNSDLPCPPPPPAK